MSQFVYTPPDPHLVARGAELLSLGGGGDARVGRPSCWAAVQPGQAAEATSVSQVPGSLVVRDEHGGAHRFAVAGCMGLHPSDEQAVAALAQV
jgi:hypothetical protein